MLRYNAICEDFRVGDINRAVKLFASLIGKRIGTKINISPIEAEYISKSEGNIMGVFGLCSNGSAIQFNWKIGSSSGNIDTIDYWKNASKVADITIDTDGMNAIQIIDSVVDAIQNGNPGDVYQELQERVTPKTKGSVSQQTAESINSYFSTMDISEDDLENRRITSDLYNEYLYWYNQLSDEDSVKYKLVPKPTFINYIKVFMDERGIINKFARTVKVKKATKQILKVSKNNVNKFKDLYKMSLEDKMDLIGMGVMAVIKGYKTASLITGTAGTGKTHKVMEVLDENNAKYKYISGGIKNARALYQVLYDNNDKNLILIFDDVNDILRNKQAVEILRTATTNDKKRSITYTDNKIAKGSRKYKPEMIFESRIIIITNIPIKKIDKAIVSRTAPIEVVINNQEIMDNIRINIENAPPPKLPTEWKLDVWDFLTDEVGMKDINRIDYRIFEQLCIFRATEDPKWKKFAFAYVS